MSARLLRMIAPGSLSAFSASVTNGAPGGRVGGAAPLQPVRAQSSGASPSGTPQKLLPQAGAPPLPAGQTLPRGSLLDLSV
jgi:hypothetical protein